MSSPRPFKAAANTVNQAVSGVSAAKQFSSRGGHRTARIVLSGATADAFFRFGDSSVTVTTSNGMPIPNGAIEVQMTDEQYIAVIGTDGTLYITDGDGI